MSKIIKSRSSCQCRSHHQKMLVKYGSIDNILTELDDLITQNNIKEVTVAVEHNSIPEVMQVKVEEVEVEMIESIKELSELKEEESSGASEEEKPVDECMKVEDMLLTY